MRGCRRPGGGLGDSVRRGQGREEKTRRKRERCVLAFQRFFSFLFFQVDLAVADRDARDRMEAASGGVKTIPQLHVGGKVRVLCV